MSEPSPNLRAFTPEEWKIVAGIYRRLGKLTEALRLSSAKPAPAAEPTQATLDLEPGSIAREIAAKPRTWCNTVKVWDAIWDLFGRDGMPITKQELYTSEELTKEIGLKTNNKVGIESLSKILSVLVRAGAMERLGRDAYHSEKPTDELREAVERVAKKRKEVAA